jgi:hypothetical protein
MHGPDTIVPLAFFAMITAISIGVPFMRAVVRRMDRAPGPGIAPDVSARLERMEQAIDSIAIEVERVSEGQRFTTRLLADRARESSPAGIHAGGRSDG